jgi:hypothetical protein
VATVAKIANAIFMRVSSTGLRGYITQRFFDGCSGTVFPAVAGTDGRCGTSLGSLQKFLT